MGKFGVGTRVADSEGDVGYITGKAGKGRRSIGNYESSLLAGMEIIYNKSDLRILPPVNDNACAEKSVNDYPAAPVAEESVWVPKVGDRVNWTRVRGEFDGSTVEGHDGVFDFLLRAANGNHTYAFASELEPAPLTIEAGKFYATRDGRKVGPMVLTNGRNGHPYPFGLAPDSSSNNDTWQVDGQQYFTGDIDDNDLVAEWVEPQVAEPNFKVGDRVRVKSNVTNAGEALHGIYPIGSEGVITNHAGPPGAWCLDGKPRFLWAKDIEPATPAFTPGTTVTFTATGKVTAKTGPHTQVVFDGLPPGLDSFALPTAFLSLAN